MIFRLGNRIGPFTIGLIKIAVSILLLLNFFTFRWLASRDHVKVATTIEGVLRSEYSMANSYALSKAITDLESLNILRCAILVEKMEIERTFYNTSGRSSCSLPSFLKNFFIHEVDLHAINGLVYHLKFQLPIKWQVLCLEFLIYLLIGLLTLLYQRHARAQSLKQAIAEALINQSKQVSHDIRSPLSALNMVVKQLDNISENQRDIIQSAANRINDIANDLLTRHKSGSLSLTSNASSDPDSYPQVSVKGTSIADLLRSIFSEKQVIWSQRPEVSLKLDLSGPTQAVCKIDKKEFARALSNLINNAVEAIEDRGNVTLALRSSLKDVAIIISDDGRGISEELLTRLGKEKVSHGKEGSTSGSGSGLGIFHARATIEAMGGKFHIQSRVGVGTQVTMTFPRVG